MTAEDGRAGPRSICTLCTHLPKPLICVENDTCAWNPNSRVREQAGKCKAQAGGQASGQCGLGSASLLAKARTKGDPGNRRA